MSLSVVFFEVLDRILSIEEQKTLHAFVRCTCVPLEHWHKSVSPAVHQSLVTMFGLTNWEQRKVYNRVVRAKNWQAACRQHVDREDGPLSSNVYFQFLGRLETLGRRTNMLADGDEAGASESPSTILSFELRRLVAWSTAALMKAKTIERCTFAVRSEREGWSIGELQRSMRLHNAEKAYLRLTVQMENNVCNVCGASSATLEDCVFCAANHCFCTTCFDYLVRVEHAARRRRLAPGFEMLYLPLDTGCGLCSEPMEEWEGASSERGPVRLMAVFKLIDNDDVTAPSGGRHFGLFSQHSLCNDATLTFEDGSPLRNLGWSRLPWYSPFGADDYLETQLLRNFGQNYKILEGAYHLVSIEVKFCDEDDWRVLHKKYV